jgi:ferredoxin
LDDVPEDQKEFIEINAELAKKWPTITKRIDPLPDADHWATVKDKRHLLDQT